MKNWEPLVPRERCFVSDEEVDGADFGVRTRTSVGHAQQEWTVVLKDKVLILELFAIDRLSTSAISSSEITSLAHKALDDTMEARFLVSE
jgi:hypothetical protein